LIKILALYTVTASAQFGAVTVDSDVSTQQQTANIFPYTYISIKAC